MTAPDWLIVAGDLTPLGGMDVGNHALARRLAQAGRVHLVTHRAWPDLAGLPTVTVRRVPRPFGKHVLGEPFLRRAGRAEARAYPAARVVVNGGNCQWPDVNWVHYVHAAYAPPPPAGGLRRLKQAWQRPRAVAAERAALAAARVVVCNSRLTAWHAVERVGVPPGRVRVVYYGTDPARFGPVTTAERAAARAALGWADRPWAVFVGALGDRRKGFDTLYEAWKLACAGPGFDANLAVVGHGAELLAWQARAVADGLADRVHFLGFRTDVPVVLAAADGLVHPARYEAYGLGVHEALCRGLPALVSAAAGVAERYPADLGDLLIPDPDDAPGLADRLRVWGREIDAWPARVSPFAAALRGRTWDDMADEFVAACTGADV